MLEFAKLVHQAIGTEYPRLFLVTLTLLGALFFGTVGWLLDRAYKNSLRPSPQTGTSDTTTAPLLQAPQPTVSRSSGQPSERLTAPKQKAPLPPPIRREMDSYQVPTVLGLIKQMGVPEMWLSQIFQRGGSAFDGLPADRGVIDYPQAVRRMASLGHVKVLETARREYADFYGEVFAEDIRFRILDRNAPGGSANGRVPGVLAQPVLELDSEEKDILVAAAASDGLITVVTSEQLGEWVRAGPCDFVDKNDRAKAVGYRSSLNSLLVKELIHSRKYPLFELTDQGYKVARELATAWPLNQTFIQH